MESRLFSDTIQYQAVLKNLEANEGQLKCDNCKKVIKKKVECHFDHIFPFSKGGKSEISNCQILCASCNLKKNDKLMHDFVLEEKANNFLFGDGELVSKEDDDTSNEVVEDSIIGTLTMQDLGSIVLEFIEKNGDIKKIDFSRERNNLPSFGLVKKYYGGLKQMKSELGIDSGVREWDRNLIEHSLKDYIATHGDILQKELISKNKLPSLPSILKYFPEFKSFTDIKVYLGLKPTRNEWTYDLALEAGRKFVEINEGKVSETDLNKESDLPHSRVIYRLFGSMADYQEAIGATIGVRNKFIEPEMIDNAVEEYFSDNIRIVKSSKEFFDGFHYSKSVISRRFGTFEDFFNYYDITVQNSKKGKFTKSEVDDLIMKYVKSGAKIPSSPKQLTSVGLPSSYVIMRFYDNWKIPFIYFTKLVEKLGEN